VLDAGRGALEAGVIGAAQVRGAHVLDVVGHHSERVRGGRGLLRRSGSAAEEHQPQDDCSYEYPSEGSHELLAGDSLQRLGSVGLLRFRD
jgi:hypothetical protein